MQIQPNHVPSNGLNLGDPNAEVRLHRPVKPSIKIAKYGCRTRDLVFFVSVLFLRETTRPLRRFNLMAV